MNSTLHNTRLRRYGYKAWETQRQYYNSKLDSYTDWHKNSEVWGNLSVTLGILSSRDGLPFTKDEVKDLLLQYNHTLCGLVDALEGKSIVVSNHKLCTGRKNEWLIQKYNPKGDVWTTIKYPTQWQTGLEGMLDICIAKGGELIIYHAEALAKRIEKSVQELEHGVLTD